MKIFAAGIGAESNTFSPVPTGLEDFLVLRGKDSPERRSAYPSIDLSRVWGQMAKARGDTFVFSLMAAAKPSGVTVRSAYESLRDEMLGDLRAALPVDIVLLHLHGAMVAQGYDGCEEDMVRRIRGVVGRDAVIGVELDLHCHLGDSLISAADIIITFKEYPHLDVDDRGREVFDLAIAAALGEIRPTMALYDCRMIGLYPTSRHPLRGFVDAMVEAEGRERVLSISFAHGFQFADLPHVGAKMLVVTDGDQALAQEVAREFGLKAHRLRQEIGFEGVSLPMDEALSRAMSRGRGPVIVADQSDNPGGGAPGDATFALRWLIEHQATDVAMAIFYDPEVVKIARKAGKGAALSVRVGGKSGPHSGAPVDLDVEVLATLDNYMHVFPQKAGKHRLHPVGDIAALRCGSMDIVVGSERCQCFSPSIFTDLGIDPTLKRIVVPKGTQHFYGAFASMASEVIYMAGPGAVAPDPRQISYRRLDTSNMYPWIDDPVI